MINMELHHIGVVTKNIEKELKVFEGLGYKQISNIFIDKKQKIKGCFIDASNQVCLELLENLHDDGPLSSCLNKDIKFYHFAYKTKDINQDLKELLKIGGIVITPITDSAYFNKICFVMLKNSMIVELVQERDK